MEAVGLSPRMACSYTQRPVLLRRVKPSMFGITDYGTFVATVVIFLAIPGPGNLALVLSTTQGGIRGGLAATLGVIVGDQLLMAAAMAGVAAVLLAYPAAFQALQWVGAAYLAWLGWKLWRAQPGAKPVLHIAPRQFFRQALGITLLNPKAILFDVAFLPLFLDLPRNQDAWTCATLALTIAALTALYGLAATLLTRFFAHRLQASPVIGRRLQQLAGTVLVGFGVKLAVSA